jgi:two-component system sensor histidine kinase PilS (NtrC family)
MVPNLRRRLLWLIGIRAAVVTLLLGSAIVIEIRSRGSLPIDPFFFVIGLTYALTVVYVLLLRQAERYRWLVDVQLAFDAIIVSALVHLTGGIASLFSSLYTLPIIGASVFRSQRGGMMVGVLSSVITRGLRARNTSAGRRCRSSGLTRCRRAVSRCSSSASTSSGSWRSRR